LEIGSLFLPRLAFLFMLPAEAEMTGRCCHSQILVEMRSHKLFPWGCPQTIILLISASRVAWRHAVKKEQSQKVKTYHKARVDAR
jgi:hypothetical protein